MGSDSIDFLPPIYVRTNEFKASISISSVDELEGNLLLAKKLPPQAFVSALYSVMRVLMSGVAWMPRSRQLILSQSAIPARQTTQRL